MLLLLRMGLAVKISDAIVQNDLAIQPGGFPMLATELQAYTALHQLQGRVTSRAAFFWPDIDSHTACPGNVIMGR